MSCKKTLCCLFLFFITGSVHNFAIAGDLEQNCISGDAESCALVAEYYEHGTNGKEMNIDKAAIFYGEACKNEAISSCRKAGLMRGEVGGEGVPIYFAIACSNADEEACTFLGIKYKSSASAFTDDQLERAIYFFQDSCQKDNVLRSCKIAIGLDDIKKYEILY